MNMRFMTVTVLDLIHSFPLLLTMSLNQLSILFKFAHWRPFDAKTDVELRRIPAFKRICEFASQPPFASRLRTPQPRPVFPVSTMAEEFPSNRILRGLAYYFACA